MYFPSRVIWMIKPEVFLFMTSFVHNDLFFNEYVLFVHTSFHNQTIFNLLKKLWDMRTISKLHNILLTGNV
jgi:hypothetical protein